METFGGMMGTPYLYTESTSEVSKNVVKHLEENLGVDIEKEGLLFATWNKRMPSGNFYVVATSDRIFARKGNALEQNYFKDIQTIEKSHGKNLSVKTASDSTALFFLMATPHKDLITKLMKVLNVKLQASRG